MILGSLLAVLPFREADPRTIRPRQTYKNKSKVPTQFDTFIP